LIPLRTDTVSRSKTSIEVRTSTEGFPLESRTRTSGVIESLALTPRGIFVAGFLSKETVAGP